MINKVYGNTSNQGQNAKMPQVTFGNLFSVNKRTLEGITKISTTTREINIVKKLTKLAEEGKIEFNEFAHTSNGKFKREFKILPEGDTISIAPINPRHLPEIEYSPGKYRLYILKPSSEKDLNLYEPLFKALNKIASSALEKIRPNNQPAKNIVAFVKK